MILKVHSMFTMNLEISTKTIDVMSSHAATLNLWATKSQWNKPKKIAIQSSLTRTWTRPCLTRTPPHWKKMILLFHVAWLQSPSLLISIKFSRTRKKLPSTPTILHGNQMSTSSLKTRKATGRKNSGTMLRTSTLLSGWGLLVYPNSESCTVKLRKVWTRASIN